MTDMRARFLAGETFAEYLSRPKKYGEFWEALYKRAVLPEGIPERSREITELWHLLVLSEDWCGDSINTLPLVARLTEAVPSIDMRIVSRDSNPDLMDAHLTGTSRSIPVIILLDSNYVERAWWGPRPRPLQEWVVAEGLALPKDERYREVRIWYARDHGKTTLAELLDMIEGVGSANPEVP